MPEESYPRKAVKGAAGFLHGIGWTFVVGSFREETYLDPWTLRGLAVVLILGTTAVYLVLVLTAPSERDRRLDRLR